LFILDHNFLTRNARKLFKGLTLYVPRKPL